MSTFKVCVCGHGEHDHGFRVRTFTETLRTNCAKCGCNRYEFLAEMEFNEWIKYQKDHEITDHAFYNYKDVGIRR